MTSPQEPGSTSFDEILERLLAGQRVDLSSEIESSPDLTDAQKRAARALANAVGRGQESPDDDADPGALPCESLGEFRLLRRLGEGSTGVVFLAEQASLRRLVAVKVLRPGLVLIPEADARLAREAHALARLRHENIVTAFSSGVDRGFQYLAMEYVEGRGLNDILKAARSGEIRPTVAQVTGWCRDVGRGLHVAHEAGIVHRDVKPSNIRITPEGRAVLLDFGLALDRPDSTLTKPGTFRGSPRYSSPEQIDSRGRDLDRRTDVYSLGVTLYEAVTLQAPFEAESTDALFAKILAGDAERPRRILPSLPRELETVIMTAIERDRERRYPTAADFARDLDALLELRDILARPPGPVRRLRRWVRRHQIAASIIAAVLLALLAGGSVVASRALATQRAFSEEERTAEAAAARGDFEASIAAWDRALGLVPASDVALKARAAMLVERDRSRGRALLAESQQLLDRSRAAHRRAEAIEGDSRRLAAEMHGRTLTVEEGKVLARGGVATADRREEEETFHAALNRALSARALLPSDDAPEAMISKLYLEKFHDALVRKDRAAERSFAKLVAEHDPRGAHTADVEGRGSVAFDVVPEGTEVHLFRYEEQADVVPGGERRLVPVPLDGAPTPVPPGTWCLRCDQAGGGLESEDQVFELEGRPIEGTFVISHPDGHGLEENDRLVSVDGRLVDRFDQLSYRMKRPDNPASRRTLVFERGGKTFTIQAASLAELGAGFMTPRGVTLERDSEGVVWSNGVRKTVHLRRGLSLRTTAAPLFLSPETSLGRAPIAEKTLRPGSYLAWLSRKGFEGQRVPFIVERGARVRVPAALRPVGTTPWKYRYIPPGPALVGRPNAIGTSALVSKTRQVPGFAICEHEVTVREFLEFLNSPGVDDSFKRFPDKMDSSRVSGMTVWAWVKRQDDGRFGAEPAIFDHPVSGVTFETAQAYARWRTHEDAATNPRFEYVIPTDVEWEKAARGADGRPFAYGEVFHALWQKYGRSSLFMRTDTVLRYPIDESPYGVFDMTGGVSEWCDRSEDTIPGEELTLRGTAWSEHEEKKLFDETEVPRGTTKAYAGFRLAIRDVGATFAESRPTSR